MQPAHTDNRFDILRLVAAWLVLFSHAYPAGGFKSGDPFVRWTQLDTFGAVGVIMFFVLSGYLVTQSLQRSPTLLDFAWRRCLRIYPALLVTVLLCVLVLGPAVTTLTWSEYAQHPWTRHYLITAGAWDIRYALPGVFADNPAPTAVNGSLWSLPYEIRCYLVLAAIGLLPGALRTKVVLALAVLLALLWHRPALPSPFDRQFGVDYYALKLGIPFTLGACFALAPQRWLRWLWLAAAGVPCAMLLLPGKLQMLLFVSGTACVALWLALHAAWLPRIPARMGDWSYGLFLYGWPVQQLLAHLGVHTWGFGQYLLLCTAAALGAAALSWRLVEQPALRLKDWRWWQPIVSRFKRDANSAPDAAGPA